MLFNSLQFAVFFIVVYALYLLLKRKYKWQNRILLVASYFFYATWDWRFLSLIIISTILDYTCGIKINNASKNKRRKIFLFLSILGNLSILGFFKYYNFFVDNFKNLFSVFDSSLNFSSLDIILPVGISFYTFQTMSYTIDIYRKKMKPTRNFFDFALFVAFFPQLVAGPIERAKNLLPQILNPRKFDLKQIYDGFYLIFWGLFQKMFVADNLATIVDPIFVKPSSFSGPEIILGVYAFAFQIFCDFAGYSNIARGVSKCMGIDIMVNFNVPYFSTNPSEFWKRWHISLSGWLRDYLYISLGGNRKGRFNTLRNLIITMFLGGLWHGAAWTFVAWGVYHGLLLVVYRILKPLSDKLNHLFRGLSFWFIIKVVAFFNFTCFGWLIFRATSLNQVFKVIGHVFSDFQIQNKFFYLLFLIMFYVGILFIVQIIQYKKNDLVFILKQPLWVRSIFYCVLIYLLVIFGVTNAEEFIYFQF